VSGEELLDWPERGQRLTIGSTLDRGVVITVADDDGQATAELSSGAIEALISAVDTLAGGRGWIPEIAHEQTLEELGSTQEQLDQANERVTALEAELRARIADLEAARTALDLADRRARGYERDIERMRSAMSALPEPVQR
jgi:phage shock protein A